MATTERENQQLDEANASGRTAVVFVHGLWLLPSSWDRWRQLFQEAGYATLTPSWPDDPETVEEARANPQVFAKKTVGQVADHTARRVGDLAEARRPNDRGIADRDLGPPRAHRRSSFRLRSAGTASTVRPALEA